MNARLSPRLNIVTIILALTAGNAIAQNAQNPQNDPNANPPMLRGAVLTVAANSTSFVIVDRTGTQTTVTVNSNTTYQSRGNDSRFSDTVQPGMNVRAVLGADGSAAAVFARGPFDQLSVEQLKAFMGVTDDEWAVIKPKIELVQALQDQLDNGGGSGDGTGAPSQDDVSNLQQTLRDQLFNNTPTNNLTSTLATLRGARAKARDNLIMARKDLADLLTPRQEVLLVVVGILE